MVIIAIIIENLNLLISDVQAKVVSEIIRKTLGIRREVRMILGSQLQFEKDFLGFLAVILSTGYVQYNLSPRKIL